jgi:hypothetical protein
MVEIYDLQVAAPPAVTIYANEGKGAVVVKVRPESAKPF